MPVKIRCRGCEKTLNAPDKARGKVIKCPNCGTALKVPGAKSSKKPVKAVSAPPESDADFLAGLDLDQAEDKQARICPYCAAELDPEDPVCRGCGRNVETGRMDEREAKRRSRKGPDPTLFYSKAWSDSKSFMMGHKDLALRTGWYWALFAVLTSASAFMVAYCEKGPPKTFWAFMTLLSFLGLPGWYWFLSMKIVEATIQRDEKLDRIHFDFFQNVTLGMRAIFWPIVMLLPVWLGIGLLFPIFVLQGGSNPLLSHAARIIGLGLIAAPMFLFPLATIHMTTKYTYKAWVLWELMQVFVRNIAPTLYMVLLGLVVAAPLIGAAVAVELVGGGLNPFFNDHFTGLNARVVTWAFGMAGEQASGWLYTTVLVVVNFVMSFVWWIPFMLLAGFPAVFIMRANGLLGYYNRRRLGLVEQMAADTPANFWVRLLSFWVDMLLFPLASFIVTKEKKALILAQLLNAAGLLMIYYLGTQRAGMFMGPVWTTYNLWMYFCVQEATTTRTTVGKDGFGLIVSTEDNRQMTLGKATIRFFSGLANVVTGGVGFLMCAFHPEKKALNDLLSKTKVVWKGDR